MTELIVHGKKLEALANEIRVECDALKGQLSDAIQRAMRIGCLLSEARKLVENNSWKRWIADNTELSLNTARHYRVAYEHFHDFPRMKNIQPTTFWYVIRYGHKNCDKLKALASEREVTNDDLPAIIGRSVRECRGGMVAAAKALADTVANDPQAALKMFAGRDSGQLADGLERLAKLLRGQPVGIEALPDTIQADLAEFREEYQDGRVEGFTLSDAYGLLVASCKAQGAIPVSQKEFEAYLNERTTQEVACGAAG